MKPGDRVAYAAVFLRAVDFDGDEAKRRGTVTALVDAPFVQVKWDDDDVWRTVHSGNLCRVRADGTLLDNT